MILSVSNIEKSFGNHKVLDDVSFTLSEGNITGLVGRNGSGKTTLLKILCGIFDQDKGLFNLDGKNLKDDPKIIENIVYLPDRFDYFNYSNSKDMIDYYGIIYPKFNKNFFLQEVNKNNIDVNKNIRYFSKGTKNLLGLIAILSTNADIILVDEILDGMDILNKEVITKHLLDAKESGKTILASSHELDELSGISDEILYLSTKGKINNISKNNQLKFNKVQIVVKDVLPEDILNNSVLRFHLGRVYTVLIGLNSDKLKLLLDREEIVQYDILPIQIEDNFYWERGKTRK